MMQKRKKKKRNGHWPFSSKRLLLIAAAGILLFLAVITSCGEAADNEEKITFGQWDTSDITKVIIPLIYMPKNPGGYQGGVAEVKVSFDGSGKWQPVEKEQTEYEKIDDTLKTHVTIKRPKKEYLFFKTIELSFDGKKSVLRKDNFSKKKGKHRIDPIPESYLKSYQDSTGTIFGKLIYNESLDLIQQERKKKVFFIAIDGSRTIRLGESDSKVMLDITPGENQSGSILAKVDSIKVDSIFFSSTHPFFSSVEVRKAYTIKATVTDEEEQKYSFRNDEVILNPNPNPNPNPSPEQSASIGENVNTGAKAPQGTTNKGPHENPLNLLFILLIIVLGFSGGVFFLYRYINNKLQGLAKRQQQHQQPILWNSPAHSEVTFDEETGILEISPETNSASLPVTLSCPQETDFIVSCTCNHDVLVSHLQLSLQRGGMDEVVLKKFEEKCDEKSIHYEKGNTKNHLLFKIDGNSRDVQLPSGCTVTVRFAWEGKFGLPGGSEMRRLTLSTTKMALPRKNDEQKVNGVEAKLTGLLHNFNTLSNEVKDIKYRLIALEARFGEDPFPLPSKTIPSGMSWEHAVMVGAVNSWWKGKGRYLDRENLLNFCENLGVAASFAQISNFDSFMHGKRQPYEFKNGEGGWLLCRAKNNISVFVLPADLNYFTNSSSMLILVDMFSAAIKPDDDGGFSFDYVFRACELEVISENQFTVKKQGYIHQPGQSTPRYISRPLEYKDVAEAIKHEEKTGRGAPEVTVWGEFGKLKQRLIEFESDFLKYVDDVNRKLEEL